MDGFSYHRGSVMHLQTFLLPCISPSKQWDHQECNAATIPHLLSDKAGHWAPCKNNVKMLLSNEAGHGYPSRHAGLLPTWAAPCCLQLGSPDHLPVTPTECCCSPASPSVSQQMIGSCPSVCGWDHRDNGGNMFIGQLEVLHQLNA